MTMQTETPSLADLQREIDRADAEAAQVGAKVADALARRDAAEAQIQAIHRARITAWAQGVVDGDDQARRDARAAITTARQDFERAVAEGSPAFLARYLDLVRATAHYIALNRRLQNAYFELGVIGPQIPWLGRLGQVTPLADALTSALSGVVSNLISDAEDATFAEHSAVVAGDEAKELDRGE